MPIVRQIHQKKIDKLFFCPYCRVLFLKSEEYEKKKSDVDNTKEYRCFDCDKYFDLETYKEQARCGKNYHFKVKGSVEEPSLYIKKVILKFHQEGYSYRDIHKLTFFSRSKIGEVCKEVKNEEELDLSNFFQKYLELGQESIEAIEYRQDNPYSNDNEELIDVITAGIEKTLDFGFTIEQVAQLYKVSNSTIYKIKPKDHKKRQRKNKISLSGKGSETQVTLYK